MNRCKLCKLNHSCLKVLAVWHYHLAKYTGGVNTTLRQEEPYVVFIIKSNNLCWVLLDKYCTLHLYYLLRTDISVYLSGYIVKHSNTSDRMHMKLALNRSN